MNGSKQEKNKFVKDVDKRCPLCNNSEEDQCHLFFNCHHARLVWSIYHITPINTLANGFNGIQDWMETLWIRMN